MELNEQDKMWLKTNHPKLKIIDGTPTIIKGELFFKMLYEDGENKFVINPVAEDKENKYFISDCYEIEIILTTNEHSSLPQVIEKGGRIQKVIEKYNIQDSRDIHVYPTTNISCLCTKTEEDIRMPRGFFVDDFINHLVIPFFYYQSFYEKYGEEPYQGYSHGSLGILENYNDIRDGSQVKIEKFIKALQRDKDWNSFKSLLANKKELKGFWSCMCGKDRFRKCHKKAFNGLWNLKDDIKNNKIGI